MKKDFFLSSWKFFKVAQEKDDKIELTIGVDADATYTII